jgi:Peptidase S46
VTPRLSLALLTLGSLTMSAAADEGMWLLNDPPRQLLKQKYDFDLTAPWLIRAQKASVRFTNGGSGGFVSRDGLIVTNHHVGADAVQKVSPPDKNYYRDGYLARSRADELKCPDMELNVLQSIEDVTVRVNAAVKPEMSPAQAFAARRAVMAEIENESLRKTGLRSDVVTLYHGGLFHLYRYKKYTDVRLVFSPEAAAAGFGGDVDNFEYPRFGFDVAFFRAYENGAPAKVEHWFKWNATGPAEGDLVFVTGHPGTTNRLETLAKLKHRRDHTLPYTLARLRSAEAALTQFAERGPDERKWAANDLHRVANSRKAFSGQYQGLLTPAVMAQRQDEEHQLSRQSPSAAPSPWRRIEEAQAQLATFEKEYSLLETGNAFFSESFTHARHLVRLATELSKPSGDRLREYRDSNLESLILQLFSPAPIHADLERAKLTSSLTFFAEVFGGEHPLVVQVLSGKNPATRAAEIVAGCKIRDVAERKKLFDGGRAAVEASDDPMIKLAISVDDEARAVRKRYENEVEEVERQGYAAIAQARFETFGKNVAPDATFTLRLAFGVVKGYDEDGKRIPFHTTFGGAFERADRMGHREPFELPKRWIDGRGKLDPATPFNFVSTADTIGGNSGSPVLNRAGELVGINFDRNRHGLVRNFVYTDVQARHIAVHCRAVLEGLRKLYAADDLLRELQGP